MVQIKKTMFFILLVLLISFVYASQETEWLIQEYNKRTRNIEETALTLLALKKQLGPASSPSSEIAKLTSYLDSCIAANNCNNKDAALAILALKEIGDTSTALEAATNWLINSRTMFAAEYDPDAEWLIQIISSSPGQCTVNNTELQKERSFNVQPRYTPWENINDLIGQNTKDLIIDCSSLQSIGSISLIKKKTIDNIENYFIKEEIQNDKVVEVQLGIPCWGSTYRSSCEQDTTAYVLLVLNKQGKNPDPTWLQQQTRAPLQNAILYEITKKQEYLTNLELSQTTSGFWSPIDVSTTSLIYSFIPSNSQPAEKAIAWIQSQKSQEGCWPKPTNICNLKSTASALYAISPLAATQPVNATPPTQKTELDDCDAPCLDKDGCICIEECKNNIISEGENCGGPKDTSNGKLGEFCVTLQGCDGQYDSFRRCIDIPGDNCPEEDVVRCNNNDVCDPEEDCSCLDCNNEICFLLGGETGICNFASAECESEDTTGVGTGAGTGDIDRTKDRREEGASTLFWFLMVLAVLIALVGGIILAYKKGLIKFKKKPPAEYKPRMKIPKEFHPETYQPRTRLSASSGKHPVKKFLDKELDKSIEELEKLLKD